MSPELADRFEHEVLPYRAQLLHTAQQLTRHRQDAEDLVQESITRACAGFHRFSPDTNLKAWLHRILVNTFINSYRKRQREPTVTVAEVEQLHGYPQPGGGTAVSSSAEEVLLSRIPADQLVAALQELPAEFRQVLYLIDVEGFSYRETSAIMKTPLGTVMSRLHRARTSMRAALAVAGKDAVFGSPDQGERAGNRSQEVPHVQRDNGGGHSCDDNRHRVDHCLRNGQPTPQATAAIRS